MTLNFHNSLKSAPLQLDFAYKVISHQVVSPSNTLSPWLIPHVILYSFTYIVYLLQPSLTMPSQGSWSCSLLDVLCCPFSILIDLSYRVDHSYRSKSSFASSMCTLLSLCTTICTYKKHRQALLNTSKHPIHQNSQSNMTTQDTITITRLIGQPVGIFGQAGEVAMSLES